MTKSAYFRFSASGIWRLRRARISASARALAPQGALHLLLFGQVTRIIRSKRV